MERVKELALMKLLNAIKLLIKVKNHKYKIKSYCLKCRKDAENIYSRVSNTSNGKTTLLWKFAVSRSKKSTFIKKQEAQGILSNLCLETPLSKVPLSEDVLF